MPLLSPHTKDASTNAALRAMVREINQKIGQVDLRVKITTTGASKPTVVFQVHDYSSKPVLDAFLVKVWYTNSGYTVQNAPTSTTYTGTALHTDDNKWVYYRTDEDGVIAIQLTGSAGQYRIHASVVGRISEQWVTVS